MPAELPDQVPSIVLATAELPCPRLSRQKKLRMRAQAHQFITQLYNEGLPVFTKTALEDIAQQFDQCAEKASYGQTIRVTALNGAIVEFPLETDNPYPYDYGDDDYRCIM